MVEDKYLSKSLPMINLVFEGPSSRLQEARERFRELQELSKTLKVLSFKEFLEQAFEIALEKNLTIYGSLYIVGSDTLITADAKQAGEAKHLGKRITLL